MTTPATPPPAADLTPGAAIALADWPAIAALPLRAQPLRAALAQALIDDPTNLALAERQSLLILAQGTAPAADWTAAVAEFRAEQDGLRVGGSLPDDAAMQRWTIDRGDPDRRALLAMVVRDQWLLSWAQPENIVLANALTPYRSAVIAQTTRANSVQLRAILDRIGWFDIPVHGEAASQAAWLIIQHADHDPAWQRAMLAALTPRAANGRFQPRYLAYLTDRVAVNGGEPQTYGTQGRCVAPGNWESFRMIDPATVGNRRAAVGLGPIADYRARFTCP